MKKFVLGLLCGAILSSTVAFAASYFAEDVSFKVLVNGKEFTSSKALAINGSTYLPLKAIGDALNIPVKWNNELKQVEVGDCSLPVSTNQSTDSTKTEVEQITLTAGQRNAKKSAENYLEIMSFSRKGLIDQLQYEGYSEFDATFAVDSLNVNWKEQAVETAKSYLDHMSFSRDGLIEQLEFEGFTTEQAEHGAEIAYK